MSDDIAEGQKRPTCRVCRIARIHIFLVVTILALWRFNPSMFAWASEADRYLVPIMVVAAVGALFVYKWWKHYRG